MRILGIDPGLRFTGWGVIGHEHGRFTHIANGTVRIPEKLAMAERLRHIHDGLAAVMDEYKPEAAAIEEVFVNMNPASTLKLGAARGVAFLMPALYGVPVFEYSANLVKKSITGVGHAGKEQIEMMIGVLLGRPAVDSEHAADALAIAICHSNNNKKI
ncbi:MAG: crossover junction endodeoxyribonuclease RuvC [Rickettsiales bacterium]|jgi:crossover junction endodeoxyribonuclease RuvC|nr:crossover junction endodeoxyribonuclease RuvC [Rickettsiales bacterium]